MISIDFTSSFFKRVSRLKKKDPLLFKEIFEKTNLFKNRANHNVLKVHKLHGHLSKYFEFWVNYKIRIIFEFNSGAKATFHEVDDHDGYRR